MQDKITTILLVTMIFTSALSSYLSFEKIKTNYELLGGIETLNTHYQNKEKCEVK